MPLVVPTPPVSPSAAPFSGASGIRDLWIGRLRLVTYDDSFQEAIGDELVLSGGVAALGARKPKRYAFTLPIHGTTFDPNPYAAAQRMRRQIRSMTENQMARAQGFYMYSWLDPEQNGWLVMGAGTIQYADGGVTLGEYSLVMDEIYRVASSRAYRPGRRIDWYDRRLAQTPRDFLGSRYSTDFANLTGGVYALSAAFAWLPPGLSDVTGVGRVLQNAYPVFSQEGYILAVVGQSYGAVLNYEQPEAQRHASDVVIWDRRGTGDWTPPYTNLVVNPLTGGNGFAPWSTSSPGHLTGSATATWNTSLSPPYGPGAVQVVTTAGNANEGIAIALAGSFAAGVPITASVFLRGAAGGEAIEVLLGSSGADTAGITATLTTGWQVFFVTWTPTAAEATAYLSLYGTHVSSVTFYAHAAQVTTTPAQVPYFDGSFPGYQWTGAAYGSTSQGPYGWVNPALNPSVEDGLTNWGTSLAATLSSSPDDPLPPGFSADVVLTSTGDGWVGPTASLGRGTISTVAGQALYAEAWVEAISGSYTSLQLALLYFDASGAATLVAATSSSVGPAVPYGSWYRLSAKFVVPAGYVAAAAVVDCVGGQGGFHFRVDNVLCCDATALGPPPTYNPPGYPNTAYFDGDNARAGWLGTRFASSSVLWLDPQVSPGWEEVYGTEHPLNQSDVPVIGNGICRVRAEQGAASGSSVYLAFAIDLAVGPAGQGGGGWQEQGRIVFGPALGTTSWTLWSQLAAVSVAEWTWERGVVRLALTGYASPTAGNRLDLYISLQRGWTAPRFEAYVSTASGGIVPAQMVFQYSPSDASGQVASYTLTNGSSTPAGISTLEAAQTTSTPTAGSDEPWVALTSLTALRPPALFIRETDSGFAYVDFLATNDTKAYGSGRAAFRTWLSWPSNGYFSIQMGYSMPGGAFEAEAYRNASGTTATVNDPTALSSPPSAPTATTSTTGGSLPTATQYDYKVSAYNATGQTAGSAASNTVTTGAGSTNSNTVAIVAVSGAIGYLVYRRTGAAGSWYLVGNTATTSFIDTGGAPNLATAPTANTSGQTSSGGQFVTDTQAAATNATLSGIPAPSAGTYALFARVRGFVSDTLSFRWSQSGALSWPIGPTGAAGAAAALTYAPATMDWTWAYVGELSLTGAGLLSVTAWVSGRAAHNPATSNAAIDVAVLVPTQRSIDSPATGLIPSPTFDGARDQAAQHLIDTRAFSEVVQR